MISTNYNRATQTTSWREWSREYWTALFTVTDATGKFRYYKKVSAPRCRQCRKLPGHLRWTGPRVCACGNPHINASSADTLPLASRLAAGIKPWNKRLTARERSAARAKHLL